MLYFPRTLALVLGLAGPAAGFGTTFRVETETAGPDFIHPNLKCCHGGKYPDDPANGPLPDGCEQSPGGYDCLPNDMCDRIGISKGINVPAGIIQEGADWCNAAVSKLTTNAVKQAACSGGNILRKQKNVMTTNGDGVEYLVCSWDSTTDRCVLAGWSLVCTTNEVEAGCSGVTSIANQPRGGADDIIVATKCSNKMEKSSLSVTASGSPRYTLVNSCQQLLLDCGGYGGVKDNGGDVDAECNAQTSGMWDDCCRGPSSSRFRELKQTNEQTAPKRESRNLQATTQEEVCMQANGELKTMTDEDGAFYGYCCDNSVNANPAPINVFGDQQTWKDTAVAPQSQALETCVYMEMQGDDDMCTCSSQGVQVGAADNCQSGPPLSWSSMG